MLPEQGGRVAGVAGKHGGKDISQRASVTRALYSHDLIVRYQNE